MRRSDRQVKAPERIKEIIGACDCCRLGFYDQGSVYIIPLNFAFKESEGKQYLYFHSALKGRKIDLLRENPRVGFEMDTGHRLQPGEKACNYSYGFQSVIGTGKAELITDTEEKKAALSLLMDHYAPNRLWQFTDKEAGAVEVIRVEVMELTCKEHE